MHLVDRLVCAEEAVRSEQRRGVFFLFGIRMNKLWSVRPWLPVRRAMKPMLRVDREEDNGLLGYRVQYVGCAR
jgi:hypothetical protein